MREYLLSLVAAAIICSITKNISNEKTLSGAMLRLVAGIIMTVTVLAPVVNLDLNDLPLMTTHFMDEASAIAAEGEEMAASARNAIISDRAEAYILDKAAAFGAALEVEVTISDGPMMPEGARRKGAISPYAKLQLQRIMEQDLQIAKENQQWIG